MRQRLGGGERPLQHHKTKSTIVKRTEENSINSTRRFGEEHVIFSALLRHIFVFTVTLTAIID